ncbi:hypothetical protein [Litoribrevibacter albus]|uniref:Uncharacterized protein n=1 Tax=Litoribrevibacter albus TaxID=1473156 RepID=A0AA37W8L7_9GAMM|nr:hypothetical protein [Litoribrevibacter albus]GLQ31646.1 hypothetical protein GCM10007876_21250 [Litoribrevibacter albus]
MALVVISIDRSKLPAHTQDEYEEWVEFKVGNGCISDENPLCDVDLKSTVKEIGK